MKGLMDSFVSTNVAFDGFDGLVWRPAEIIVIVQYSHQDKMQ